MNFVIIATHSTSSSTLHRDAAGAQQLLLAEERVVLADDHAWDELERIAPVHIAQMKGVVYSVLSR